MRYHFQTGQVLFSQGEPGEEVFLVRRGLVEILWERGQRRRRLNLRGRGEVVGEMALLDGLGRSATAQACTPVEVLGLHRRDFERLILARPALSLALTRQLSHRLRELQETLGAELERREQECWTYQPEQLGPFTLEGQLGRGGMGIIYQASHSHSGHRYALKLLNVQGPEQRSRLLRECETMARLIHPNIVRIDSAGIEGAFGYFTMELLRGETLAQRLQRGPLLPLELRRWFLPICRALSYAHQQGIVHRDIKPANLWLTLEGQVKLLDFGIARRVNGPELTLAGRFFGSPAYLAPERVGAQSSFQERGSDQYSLGVCLYEAACGRRPFDSEDVAELLSAHLHQLPTPPSRWCWMAPALEAAILRMLSKDPQRRFSDFRQLEAVLDQILPPEPEATLEWSD